MIKTCSQPFFMALTAIGEFLCIHSVRYARHFGPAQPCNSRIIMSSSVGFLLPLSFSRDFLPFQNFQRVTVLV